MRMHIEVLGWLYVVWGAFGLLTGTSLFILAFAARAVPSAQGILALGGGLLVAGGAAFVATGAGVRRHRAHARFAALVLAVPTVVLVPFGSALAMYACWVLLNNDARRAFGRAPHAPPS